MNQNAALLLLLLGLGLVGRNLLIVLAAAAVLVCSLWQRGPVLPWLSQHGIFVGLLFLTLAVLAPIASGRVRVHSIAAEFLSWRFAVALLSGIAAAWISARGVELMTFDPKVMVGLVVGSIVGAAFLHGIPVGPLAAAGFAALAFYFLELLK